MIEGVFVRQGSSRERLGFHTTFRLTAFSARDGAGKLGRLLEERMSIHDVRGASGLLFCPYYWIHDVWEISGDFYNEGRRPSGFTFFRIGIMDTLYLAARRIYFFSRRRWLLIQPEGDL